LETFLNFILSYLTASLANYIEEYDTKLTNFIVFIKKNSCMHFGFIENEKL